MRPEKLVLEGVYSYRNLTEIDFDTLCRAELFGIFGKVGSGKSAVLEAVTYVLYGRIERLSSKMMNYNMMNLSSDRMFIDFTFLHKNKRYRFSFEAKRNKKEFEKIETPRRSAYVQQKGEWLPLFDRDSAVSAEDIIGLNYDNFRRTIIIPQGRFQEFLHLEKKGRTEMLMELFRLNRFDLFSNAARLSSRTAEQTAMIEGKLEGLSDATIEALDKAAEDYETLDKAAAELSVKVEKSDLKLNEHTALEKLYEEIGAAEEHLRNLKGAGAGFEKRRAELAVFESCRNRFKSILEIYDHLTVDFESAGRQYAAAADAHEAADRALKTAVKEYETVSAEYGGIDKLKEQAAWYSDLAKLSGTRVEAEALKKRILQAENAADELKRSAEQTGLEYASIQAELEKSGSGKLNVEEMSGLSAAFKTLRELESSEKVSESALKDLNEEKAGIEEGMKSFADLDQVYAQIESQKKELRRSQIDAEILNGIGELAARLEDGRPCPVCGSVEHPAPAGSARSDNEFFRHEAERIAESEAVLKKRRDEFISLQHRAGIISERIESETRQVRRYHEEREKALAVFSTGSYSPDEYDRFSGDYSEFLRQTETRDALLKKLSAAGSEKERLGRAAASAAEQLSTLKVQLGRAETRVSETESRIDPVFLNDNSQLSAGDCTDKSTQLNNEAVDLAGRFSRAETAKKDASVRYEKHLTEKVLFEQRLKELTARLDTARKNVEAGIDDSAFSSIDEVRKILLKDLDTEAERKAIELFGKELAAAENQLKLLSERASSRTYDPQQHAEERELNIGLKQKYSEAVGKKGETGNILKELRRKLELRTGLEKEFGTLKVRAENLAVLKNLFKGQKFVDYAATVYLRELCEAANARFRKLTRESLRLELDENNNFIIRDYLNEGKTRSVKTLSGGQTFQAAFSLSLALADSIGRERSGFFFLDEGFGALDRESLSLVFDSLKSLKKEKRTVGIISHVEELKQEIDTFVTVDQNSDEGSIIKNSWD